MGGTGLVIAKSKCEGLYRGLIVNNDDPDQMGKCRIRIYPMFCELSEENLPWAVPAFGLFEGAGLDMGAFTVPSIGTYVFVFFEAGDVYQPVYFAAAQTATLGIPTSAATNYPKRKVWKTTGGTEIVIDDESNLVRINHPTGTYVEIQDTGDVKLDPLVTKRTITGALSHTVEFIATGTVGGKGGLVCLSGSGTVTVPSATAYEGMMYKFKRLTAGSHTVLCPPAVDGDVSFVLANAWASQQIISNGVQWLKI